ncbi:MAG: cbb3-type cytochrome oxidase assembly protein CcoS [Abyssibacter sp.]|uniref:cbb3-type cytochrome oxidase assembly protein CcoS n=1 Tax=Abyssibacter sp. TaxID=2320200 RepID=UPI0032191FA1
MSSLLLLIPISLVLVAAAIAVLMWALNSGQYDRLDNRMPDVDSADGIVSAPERVDS